jgi:hypothetical protein
MMKESKPSTDVTGKGPQMSMWINSSTLVFRLAPFFMFFTNLPLMQSTHCSNSESSSGGSIDSLTKNSILPLEIWPKRQCHNFDEESILFLFLLSSAGIAF